MTKKIKKIKLSVFIAKAIFSRQAICLIKDEIFAFLKQKNVDIVLDFDKVNFISRSFADEILELQEQMRNKKVSLNLVNKSDEIENMLEITSFQKKNKTKIKVNLKAVNLEKIVCQF